MNSLHVAAGPIEYPSGHPTCIVHCELLRVQHMAPGASIAMLV